MQEAKDSSEIENIVTTHDELYRDDASPETASHSHTKIKFTERDLKVSRPTATGFLKKEKHGRSNYYINQILDAILTGQTLQVTKP